MSLRHFYILLIFNSLIWGCQSHPSGGTRRVEVVIETIEGDILVELYGDKAPESVKAFLAVVDKGLYKRASFYRVMNTDNQASNAPKAEFIQGGLWSRTKKRPALPSVPHESTAQTGLTHLAGTISFARDEPGTASSEFFICVDDQPGLDFGGPNNPDGQGYAAFGKVIRGMEVVRKIYGKPESGQYFDPPVHIITIERN